MSKVNQLGRRTCAELQDLKMIKIDQEYDDEKLQTNICREQEYIKRSTPVVQVERRIYEDLNNLVIDKIQFTKDRGHLIAKGMRIEKPFKIYKNKYKVLFKYEVKMKH